MLPFQLRNKTLQAVTMHALCETILITVLVLRVYYSASYVLHILILSLSVLGTGFISIPS